jgi:hypothetical protein
MAGAPHSMSSGGIAGLSRTRLGLLRLGDKLGFQYRP